MSRKKKGHAEEHENHERWLVSYADFITLLFAFFTVLYANSQTDAEKLEAVIDGMNAAFDQLPLSVMEMLTPGTTNSDLVPTHLTMEEASDPAILSLKRNLAGSLSDNIVQIGMVNQTLTLTLPEKLLFASGSADLHPAAYGVLGEIAAAVKNTSAEVRVIGPTDGTALGKDSPFKDNWGLATARAVSTTRYLESRGVGTKQMLAAGRILDAKAPEARAVRIQIHITEPELAMEVMTTMGEDSMSPRAADDSEEGKAATNPK